MEAMLDVTLPGIKKQYTGKVRDLYKVDKEHMIIVATDRVSAFDHVFPNGIPGKGAILNRISNLWFNYLTSVGNHIVETDASKFPAPFDQYTDLLKDRSVLVKKTRRIDFECVARGYIIGSGWKDYQKSGAVCGIELPSGLQMAEQLPSPIFTPATKADEGHDENVSIEVMTKKLGIETAEHLASVTLQIYQQARDVLAQCGILLADTKFEFGYVDNEIILIDEALTPDSSRFWDKASYILGESPVSFDKQFIRDYLETTQWDKNSPPPALPEEIIEKTLEKYQEIEKRLTEQLLK
jgi:phosphoribosylaminoimidazole-succinocarboxamide synthase